MTNFFLWLKKQMVHVFPIFLFFFLTFYLINFTDGLMHRAQGLSAYGFFAVFITAGVMAKIVILADYLPIMKRLPEKPLINKIIWKTLVYWVIALFMRILEQFLPFIMAGEGLNEEYEKFIDHVDWGQFWGIQIWCLILFFIFVAYRELYAVLGSAKIRQIFLGRE